MKTATEGGGTTIRRVRTRAIVFVILTLLAGAAAVVLVRVSLIKARQRAGEVAVKTVPVVVAAENLAIATKLEPRHLKAIPWPAESVPAGAYRRIQQVVGRSLTQSVVEGEPVLRPRIAGGSKGAGLAALLADGRRAMAVKVDQVIGIAGFIQTGDFVDVITTMAPDEEGGPGQGETSRVGKIILQSIKVLAVGEQLQTTGNQTNRVTVVTLEVDPAQSERLALAAEHGTIQLTMRSRIDQATVPTPGVTPAALLLPDEGAEIPEARVVPPPLVAARPPLGKRPPVAMHRPPVTKQAPASSATPAAPAVPVVEILRPGRVEQRQLRPGNE